jgi:SpoVK/Ycf46/Vps4 family AAA+-type ATPase
VRVEFVHTQKKMSASGNETVVEEGELLDGKKEDAKKTRKEQVGKQAGGGGDKKQEEKQEESCKGGERCPLQPVVNALHFQCNLYQQIVNKLEEKRRMANAKRGRRRRRARGRDLVGTARKRVGILDGGAEGEGSRTAKRPKRADAASSSPPPPPPLTAEQSARLAKLLPSLTSLPAILALGTEPDLKPLLAADGRLRKIHALLPTMRRLDRMVGLKAVKQELVDICLHQLFSPRMAKMQNIVILGPPGVGKSRLSKVIAKLFAATGRVRSEKLTVAKRSDLVGKYLGHTAAKTQEVIERSRGGVLLIDEVYSLGTRDGRDSFAKECIDTLTRELTESPRSVLCIVAGYEKDVEDCFFGMNQGLKRRFPITIKIPGYSAAELHEMFERQAKKADWALADTEATARFIKQHKATFRNQAGDVDSLLQRVELTAGRRVWLSETPERVITMEDIKTAHAALMMGATGEEGGLTENALSIYM